MKYIKFTHVDATTGVSIATEPTANGPAFPAVPGLAFGWARESQYPVEVPEFFGTCPNSSNTQVDGVLAVLTQAEYEAAQTEEMAARAALSTTARKARLERRFRLRAAAKDGLIGWMAADNVMRIQAGEWTVPDLISLLTDLAPINLMMQTLSFELAAQAIAASTNPLLTDGIKAAWGAKLTEHFYL